MKKILIIFIVVFSLILIVLGLKDKKVFYLSIGDFVAQGQNDNNYYNEIRNKLKNVNISLNYTKDYYRTIDLINEINNNQEIIINNKKKTIQNALIKADIITLSIGMNDVFSNLSIKDDYGINNLYDKFDNFLSDLENLFKLLRIYSKEKIYYIGLTSNYLDFNSYMDKKLEDVCSKYSINYIKISNDFYSNNYLNKMGYDYIANEIITKYYQNT